MQEVIWRVRSPLQIIKLFFCWKDCWDPKSTCWKIHQKMMFCCSSCIVYDLIYIDRKIPLACRDGYPPKCANGKWQWRLVGIPSNIAFQRFNPQKKQDSNYQQLHCGMLYNHPNFNPKRNRWQTFSDLNRPCHLGILPSTTQKKHDIFFSQAASVQSVMLASTRKASQPLRIESRRSVSYPSWTVSLHTCNVKSSFVSPTGYIKRWRSLNFPKRQLSWKIIIYIYL